MRPLDLAAYAYKHLPCHEMILYDPHGGWLYLSQKAQDANQPKLMLSTSAGLTPISLAELGRRFGPLLGREDIAA